MELDVYNPARYSNRISDRILMKEEKGRPSRKKGEFCFKDDGSYVPIPLSYVSFLTKTREEDLLKIKEEMADKALNQININGIDLVVDNDYTGKERNMAAGVIESLWNGKDFYSNISWNDFNEITKKNHSYFREQALIDKDTSTYKIDEWIFSKNVDVRNLNLKKHLNVVGKDKDRFYFGSLKFILITAGIIKAGSGCSTIHYHILKKGFFKSGDFIIEKGKR